MVVKTLWLKKMKLWGFKFFRNIYFTAEGQAQSKKLARRKAAIIVLEEMKKVIEAEEKEKPQQGKGKGRNKKKSSVIKETEIKSPDVSLHPVSRLAQIQQAAKGKFLKFLIALM